MAGSEATLPLRAALCLVVLPVVLAAPAAAADSGAQPRSMTVITSEYRFSPNILTIKRGVPYRLHLENHGKETHEFTAPAFFKAVELGDPAVLNADRTEIVLQPGETKELRFVARIAGRYSLRCSDHDWAGMTGKIVVR